MVRRTISFATRTAPYGVEEAAMVFTPPPALRAAPSLKGRGGEVFETAEREPLLTH